MKSKVFNTRIRGARFHDRAAYSSLRPGTALILVREADNPYDPNAILVLDFCACDVGYIAREDAARIAPVMDQGNLPLAHVRHRRPFVQVRFDFEEDADHTARQLGIREHA